MADRLLFKGPLGTQCYAVRIRGSALLVYFLGLAWIMLSIVNGEDPNYVRAALILGPTSIVTGGSLVFLANTRPDSISPRPEWPSLLYAVLGAFSTGISIPSLPPGPTLGLVALYSMVIFLSLPVNSEHQSRGVVLPIRTTILGTPVGIHAQPISPDERETV